MNSHSNIVVDMTEATDNKGAQATPSNNLNTVKVVHTAAKTTESKEDNIASSHLKSNPSKVTTGEISRLVPQLV